MDEERAYVIWRRLEGADKDELVLVSQFDLKKYQCGLRAGDRLRLSRPIPLEDDKGRFTGETRGSIGEVWTVLTGSSQDPDALWLRRPDGALHSWDDCPKIFQQFEKIDDRS